MKLIRLLTPVLFCAVLASAQSNSMLPENSITKVSDHVWAIMGFPNVIIVGGTSATLVIDTGLGAKNGAIVMRQVEKVAKNPKLFLATTHFHPEHAGGEQAFPPNTIILRNAVQQREMEQHGMEMIDMFRGFSAQNKELLEGVKFRQPDVVFDADCKLDLGGGVTARLLFTGGGHTEGDLLTFVEPDRTLISGDLVEKNQMPAIFGAASSMTRWLASLDKLAALNARYVAPDHGDLGDGTLVAKQKAFMTELRDRAIEGKRQGKTVEDTAAAMLAAMTPKYPGYNLNANNMTNVAKKVWSEN